MKSYAVYLAVLVACGGLFSTLKGMESGVVAALVICSASLCASGALVSMGRRAGWLASL